MPAMPFNRSGLHTATGLSTGLETEDKATFGRSGRMVQTPFHLQTTRLWDWSRMVKKVVRYDKIRKIIAKLSGALLIEPADNPRPVSNLCQQTQYYIQDHDLQSPRARPESAPVLSLDMSQQVVQKQEEK